MGINIGDNNKINKSVIGNNNDKEQKESKLLKIVLELLIGTTVGLIVGFCIYKFGWNK